MNIQNYYKTSSRINFYTSWVSLVFAAAFFVLHITKIINGNILYITGPFLLISLAAFWRSRINENRGRELYCYSSSLGLFEESNILLAFMPAPTLRILLFEPGGNVIGEIRDMNMKSYLWFIPYPFTGLIPRRYGLYDSNGSLISMYTVKGIFTEKMVIQNKNGAIIGIYKEGAPESAFKMQGMVFDSSQNPWIPLRTEAWQNGFTLENCDGKKIGSLQKGIMPLEWGARFKEPNTPVLRFQELAEESEKIAAFGICASIFNSESN
ncbi:hypothetical protein JOC77_001932 [Peribacillus deserti]|uniref:ABC transporter ATP-binding protein n=1 Tax=Peribacillus deserti TaxID=673318 RepID=A0ABS2QHB6_9BACI|nr:hypothetical protein [Peribacillus deserti]MBM7692502.1 hypothetical protein [Peribacillus deserti]